METGYLARYQDASDLANGINTILGDSALRRRMGERCRKVVEEEYSIDLQTQRFENLYTSLLQAGRVI
jgi:glycosyltransferase involved in cell wall biosynthesis